jgi:hypothetical protein
MTVGVIAASYVDISATNYRDEVMADNPWGYWRMRDLASPLQDETANDRDAVQANVYEPLWNELGPKGRAVKYYAGDYYCWSSATYTASTVSLEFWFKVPAVGDIALVGSIQSLGNPAGDKSCWLMSNGKIRWYCYDGAAHNLDSATTFVANTWYHVVVSVGPGGQKIIVNGVLDAINPAVVSSYTGASNHVVQHVATNGGGFIVGAQVTLAEVAAYIGSELSVARSLVHYLAPGTPRTEPFAENRVTFQNNPPKIPEDMPIGAEMLLFTFEYTRLQGLDATTAPTSSGWTLVAVDGTGTGDGGGLRLSCLKKICAPGDPGSTVPITYQSGIAAHTSYGTVIGWDTVTALDTATANVPSASNLAVTTTQANERIVYFIGAYRSNGGAPLSIVNPVGSVVTDIQPRGDVDDTHGAVKVAFETKVSAGVSTVRTWTEANGVGAGEMGVLAIPIKV